MSEDINNSVSQIDSGSTNVETSVSPSETVLGTQTSEYSYVPSKFLEDGKPNFEKLSQSYVELEKRLGGKAPAVSADDYDFNFQQPDNWDMEQFNGFKEQAQQLGMTKEQFNTAMSLYEQNIAAVVDQYSSTPEKCSSQLQQDWGKDFEPNLKSAFKAFQSFAPEGLDINDPSIGNNPAVIKLLSNIGKQMGEDSGLTNNSTTSGKGLSKMEIQEYMARPDYFTNPEIQKIVTGWYNENYK